MTALPYNGTEGASGSAASYARADRETRTGRARHRQTGILGYLLKVGPIGATWRDIEQAGLGHHGQVTGSLTSLHKAGKVQRLKNQRNSASVYVLPQFVKGRDTSPYRPNRNSRQAYAEEVRALYKANPGRFLLALDEWEAS